MIYIYNVSTLHSCVCCKNQGRVRPLTCKYNLYNVISMVSALLLTRCVSMLKGRKVVRLFSSLDSILMPSREAHLPTWQ